jgi:hypothetical protein
VVACAVRSNTKCARPSCALPIAIAVAAVRLPARVMPQISIALLSGSLGSVEKTSLLDTTFRPRAASQPYSVGVVVVHYLDVRAVVWKSLFPPARSTSSLSSSRRRGLSGVPGSLGPATETTSHAPMNSRNGGGNRSVEYPDRAETILLACKAVPRNRDEGH